VSQVPPKQTVYSAFNMKAVAEPNPEGGDPIRNLIVFTPGETLVFPLVPESADRVAGELRDKQIVTPTDGEAATILGANGRAVEKPPPDQD
jgi:F420-0:gamma-glutamyl ligase-like protein